MRRLSSLVLATLVLIGSAGPALAEWRRAESPNFIVYSDGREGALREYVRNLEIFDSALRTVLPVEDGPIRKLPIYLVGGRQAVGQIHPYLQRNVGGVYIATSEDIFAVAIRNIDEDILRHEYVHHFMLQNFTAAYPAWLVEGFAEYYAATEIEDGAVTFGAFNPGRVAQLSRGDWLPIEELLTLRGDQVRGGDRYTYYPVAWLMTHWFLSDPERSRQLQAYVDDVGRGTPSVEAMQRATGLAPDQIRRELTRYFSGRVLKRELSRDFPEPEITVTRLGPAADDLLLINQRLKIATPDADRAGVVAEVRRRAARHGDDPLALLALGHAELHFGDAEAGVASLSRLVQVQPDHVEALQLMATHHMRLARESSEGRADQLNQAIRLLGRAYQADPENYYTLMLLGQAREGAPNYPTDNDLITWQAAFDLAPQLANTRLGFARALMQADRPDEAAMILPPLANAPHGGPAAEAARELLTRAENRQAPLTQEQIDAAGERQARATPDGPEPADESDGEGIDPTPDAEASGLEEPSPPPSA
jgi:hypothetical protein